MKYTLHVVSYIQKDLTIRILKLIDPDGTVFVMKEKRVKFYEPGQAKQTGDVLERSYNKNDFVIIDRTECPWMYTDQQKLLLLKTFAPISGKVIEEKNRFLSEFPLRIEHSQPVRPISNNYPPQSPNFSSFGDERNNDDYLPFKVLRPASKPHIVLQEEAVKETTLLNLQERLNKAFD